MSASSTKVDGRSIGELLLDADCRTRQLLIDVTGDDAPAMLRTWGEVVQAAGELWSALPATPLSGPLDGATMRRLETMSQAQHRAQLSRGWPGDGPSDERLLDIADTFQRAAELASGPGRRINLQGKPAAYEDAEAARMRVMHTLYVGAHAVGMALYQHQRDLEPTAIPSHYLGRGMRDIRDGTRALAGVYAKNERLQAQTEITGASKSATRLAAFEQLAGSYVGNRFSQVTAGEHYSPPRGSGRLHEAMVSWDVQAHRTLAATPTVPNLHLVARTQAMIAAASVAILDAAASQGKVGVDDYQHRLAPALGVNQQSWIKVASSWSMLSSRGERAEPALVHSANEVRAAVHEFAFDPTRTRWAPPEVIASRIDLADAAVTVQQAMVAAAEMACVHRDVAEQEPELIGSVRGISRVTAALTHESHGESAARQPDADLDIDIGLVARAAAYSNHAVPLPAIVRNSLVADADRLVDVSEAAMSASGALSETVRQDPGLQTAGAGLRPEERDPVPTSARVREKPPRPL